MFAGSIAAMAALIVLAGLALAPSTAIEYLLVDRVSPPGTSTEAFGWVITATVAGAGAGEALTGAIVQQGNVRLGLTLALGGAAFGVPWSRGSGALRSRAQRAPSLDCLWERLFGPYNRDQWLDPAKSSSPAPAPTTSRASTSTCPGTR